MQLEAVFVEEGFNAVLFVDANGKKIELQSVADGQNAVEPTNLPTLKPGYQLKDPKWNQSLTNITENKIIALQYVLNSDVETFELKVNGGQITGGTPIDGEYPYNEVVTIEASPAPVN